MDERNGQTYEVEIGREKDWEGSKHSFKEKDQFRNFRWVERAGQLHLRGSEELEEDQFVA